MHIFVFRILYYYNKKKKFVYCIILHNHWISYILLHILHNTIYGCLEYYCKLTWILLILNNIMKHKLSSYNFILYFFKYSFPMGLPWGWLTRHSLCTSKKVGLAEKHNNADEWTKKTTVCLWLSKHYHRASRSEFNSNRSAILAW